MSGRGRGKKVKLADGKEGREGNGGPVSRYTPSSRASQSSAFDDANPHEAKSRVNTLLARHHGVPSPASTALVLDGPRLNTCRVLFESEWDPSQVHLPNASRHDFDKIKGQKVEGLHVYHSTVTDTLKNPQFKDVVGHRLSLVYLDYMRVVDRQADLRLLSSGYMEKGVIAITCPAQCDSSKITTQNPDRHLEGEKLNLVRIGGFDVNFDLPLSGLFKVPFEVGALWTADQQETILYQSPGKTWMWVTIFKVVDKKENGSGDASVISRAREELVDYLRRNTPIETQPGTEHIHSVTLRDLHRLRSFKRLIDDFLSVTIEFPWSDSDLPKQTWEGNEHLVNIDNCEQYGLNDYLYEKYGGMMGLSSWFEG